jgi:HK97 family phage major capsid protein
MDTLKEGMAIRDSKGYTDSECREKLERLDGAMNKRFDDMESRMKSFAERQSRPPGTGSQLALPSAPPTISEMVVGSDQFKQASFNGRVNFQITLKGVRLRPGGFKAGGGLPVPTPLAGAGTITEGGPIVITPPAGAYPIFPYRVGVIPQAFPPLIMRDIVPVIPLDGTNAVEYVRESWAVPMADYQVNEGDKKVQTGVTYTEYTAAVRTIANFVKVSRQMAMDVPFIMTTIEQRVSLGCLLKEDKEILYGDNTAGHLWGLMNQATKLATFWTMPVTGNTYNSLDELNIAATHIENQFYFPTNIILNPTDEAKMEMLKTSFGSYVLNDRSPQQDGIMRLWGLPVVTTPNMNTGDFLVGAFPGQCALFDRETVVVEIAFQNEDDFVRNLITIRAEERVALAVFVPAAFVCGPFQTPPCAGGGPFTSTILGNEPPAHQAAPVTHASMKKA